ncbi:AAA family ATPase [Sutterella seckii]|uniref:AAA family ATPase n=1 Tax=Sutterella seckii TaxID=1944635 RepID=A0A6I1EHG7_9BURK|nr:AAA family ATPase [Sutterella seckii]
MIDIFYHIFDIYTINALSFDLLRASYSLRFLSTALHRVYGVKPIILLDEYDTPMQEAWLNGYWDELAQFVRAFMNLSFKDNPSLERALLTGITRVSKESIFSDLNNPDVITVLSDEYQTAFGFTEAEVAKALKEYGLSDLNDVKTWYDGFSFGSVKGIYNPWSVTNYLKKKRLAPYWANTSSNELAGRLVQTGNSDVKQAFESLLNGGSITVSLCEEIVFQDMQTSPAALWSLLLASGYLKVVRQADDDHYELALTNLEVLKTFDALIGRWFSSAQESNYPDFIEALLTGDIENMNFFLNQLTCSVFSFFDASGSEPERFYHGFVLGLLVSLRRRYVVTSNRESGLGRCDVMLEPLDKSKDLAFILEFKAKRPGTSGTLEDAVKEAHEQIERKRYREELIGRGIEASRIRVFGFAFEGKRVLVG